jgi:hypothetical protein
MLGSKRWAGRYKNTNLYPGHLRFIGGLVHEEEFERPD